MSTLRQLGRYALKGLKISCATVVGMFFMLGISLVVKLFFEWIKNIPIVNTITFIFMLAILAFAGYYVGKMILGVRFSPLRKYYKDENDF